jgi:hypothetical protein
MSSFFSSVRTSFVCSHKSIRVPYVSISNLWKNESNDGIILKQFWDRLLKVQFYLRAFWFCWFQSILVAARPFCAVRRRIVCGFTAFALIYSRQILRLFELHMFRFGRFCCFHW